METRKTLFDILTADGEVNLKLEYSIIKGLLDENVYNSWVYVDLSDELDKCVKKWKYSKRCNDFSTLCKKVGIINLEHTIDNNKYLLYFELVYNLLITNLGNIEECLVENATKVITDIASLMDDLGYKIEENEEGYIIVEKDALATAAAVKNPDVCKEIIEYKRFNMDGNLERKKEILVLLAGKIEGIREKIEATTYATFLSDINFMLNNIHIRHNNKEGTSMHQAIIEMSDAELESWYDKTYDMMLGLLVINDYLDDKEEIKKLKIRINKTKQ